MHQFYFAGVSIFNIVANVPQPMLSFDFVWHASCRCIVSKTHLTTVFIQSSNVGYTVYELQSAQTVMALTAWLHEL